jgi:hypothetical protein
MHIRFTQDASQAQHASDANNIVPHRGCDKDSSGTRLSFTVHGLDEVWQLCEKEFTFAVRIKPAFINDIDPFAEAMKHQDK